MNCCWLVGVSLDKQRHLLNRRADIVIATPGRLIDLFERGALLLADTCLLVIDEADRMLDMGFIPDVERIINLLPRKRQTLLFSATFDQAVSCLADRFLYKPIKISTTPQKLAAETIVQGLIEVNLKKKLPVLLDLLHREDISNGIIFCNRKRDISKLCNELKQSHLHIAPLHGDMPPIAAQFNHGELPQR